MRPCNHSRGLGVLVGGVVGATALLSSPSLLAATAQSARKPNIIVIVADDLGYGEIKCQGAQDIPTPHVRSIAERGVGLTCGYVTCPVCSPTRAALLTGRYQQRFGHEFNPGAAAEADEQFGLPLSETTLADRLKKIGYATGLVGKWHLGFKSEYRPLERGFDEFFGFLGGAHSYVDSQADPDNRIYRGNEPVEEEAYLTDALGREAVAFIERHKQEPFFLLLTFNAVHAPLQGTDRHLRRFSQIADPRRRTFAAMLSNMDDNIGDVLAKVASEKLLENTLVFFISDNGGPTTQTTSRNDPLRGFKAQVWEGGIRVPFMVMWKGKLPTGKIYNYPVSSLDIVPTALAAAGATEDGAALDGVNLLPYLANQNSARPHESLYWRFGTQWAIRKGDLKLVRPLEGRVQLFDLGSDMREENNLVTQQPAVAAKMQKEYQAWNSELKAPLWQGRQGRAAAQADPDGKAKGKTNGKAKAKAG